MIDSATILRKYLKEKNISQKLFSNMMGVTPQYISNILNRKKLPSEKFIKNSIKILKISNEDSMLMAKYDVYKKNNKIYEDISKKIYIYAIYSLDGLKKINEEKYLETNFLNIEDGLLVKYEKEILIFNKKVKNINENNMYLLEIDKKEDIVKIEYIDNMICVINLNNEKNIYKENKLKKFKIIAECVGSLKLGGNYE